MEAAHASSHTDVALPVALRGLFCWSCPSKCSVIPRYSCIHHSVLPIEKGTMPQDMPGNSTSPPSCQPTSSVYSPVADVLWFNLGRHTEHHDFPEVPWYRLHYLSALASEHYDSLGRFTSVAEVFDRFVREHKTWGYACQGRVPFTTLTA